MTALDTQTFTSDTAAPDIGHIVIKCMSLTKIFRDFWLRNRVRAVDGIDFEVHRGELFGLLGPNGSGKSTTIKMILGLLHPTSGRIAVLGKRPEDVQTKKMIGYLPEESYLYRFLNARETLDYYGRLFHLSRPQRMRRIDMLLDMVGLEAVQRRPVGEYSKGMQRRIGLAQALINDPHLLILDEPTTGLDPIGTRQIKDLLIELKRRGKTILLCSHLLSDVEDVCDRVSIMFGGKVRAEGTVGELLTLEDKTTIETSHLDAETIQQIEQVLAARGKAIDRVDQPRVRLEALFLDIVHRAQAEGVATAGARAGGRIAEFLRSEQPEIAVEGAQVIESLVKAPEAAKPAAPAAQAPKVTPKPAEESHVIQQLVTGPRPTDAPKPAAKTTDAKPEQKEEVDRSVIDSLLNKPKE